MRLELVRNSEVFGGRSKRLGHRLRPKCVAEFAAFPGAQTVERETKRDSNEPGAEAVAVAQSIELAIGAQQGFLGNVFGVSRVAQDAASHAIGKRATLGEALLELALGISLACLARPLILLVLPDRKAVDRAIWLDHNQLLLLLSCAASKGPPTVLLIRRRHPQTAS